MGIVSSVICSRTPSRLCPITSHAALLLRLCGVFLSVGLCNSPKLSALGWEWGMRMCRINVNGSFPIIVKEQETLEKNFFAPTWSTLSLTVQSKSLSFRESHPSGMPQEHPQLAECNYLSRNHILNDEPFLPNGMKS